MRTRLFVAFILGLSLPTLLLVSPPVSAQGTEIERLQQEINNRSNRLSEIDAEIAKFEQELNVVGAEKKTLQSAINRLEVERKKVNAEISRTETLISSTDLEINKLALEINKTEKNINGTKDVIASIIRREYQSGDTSLVEVLLGNEQLSDFWNQLEAHHSIREVLSAKVAELNSYQEIVTGKKGENENKRDDLSSLKNQYTGQTQVLESNKQEQAELLEVTKNEEQNYQQLLASKQETREQILKEMRDYESKLQFILDPATVPTVGSAVFAWPLDNIVITQYFGGTEFAARNAGVYGGRAYHPGVDFGAPSGTPIKAPLSGTVRATGNTDLVPGCYSWGKWTLIDHANGLSTLYAHQSVQSVSAGQKVTTGEIIGYVGSTGFSTGPHLHFTVYAKDGVNVRRFNEIKTVTSCGPATTPIAAIEAYIDPMNYLPAY
ncbi:MAG: peptidoglycan DD-metalloendopeptidase family protein [Candidatus Pacebacteria bacterium]|nr:peptidoglycan DD-metalloendopeptidase family protein [Candidatus Paceibacterota bacterium]